MCYYVVLKLLVDCCFSIVLFHLIILNYSLFYKIIFVATDTTDTTATATAKKAKKATADNLTTVAADNNNSTTASTKAVATDADNNKSTDTTSTKPAAAKAANDGELLLLFYYFMIFCCSFCFLYTLFILFLPLIQVLVPILVRLAIVSSQVVPILLRVM